jgi:hypothetical protein
MTRLVALKTQTRITSWLKLNSGPDTYLVALARRLDAAGPGTTSSIITPHGRFIVPLKKSTLGLDSVRTRPEYSPQIWPPFPGGQPNGRQITFTISCRPIIWGGRTLPL